MQLPAPSKQLARLYSGLASDRRRNCTRLHRGCNDALLLRSRPSPALPNRSHYLDLRLRHWIAPNIHYLNLSMTGGELQHKEAKAYLLNRLRNPSPPALSLQRGDGAHQDRAVISKSLRVHTCSRKPLLARSYRKAVILALHLLGISQNFLRRYTAPQHQFDGHHDNPKIKQ